MATGRIGTTPVLTTRWSKAPANGTTSLSGLDDNSVSLVYSVGYEQVYRNGVLLSRGNDYTATNGTSITLTDATVTGDIIEVFANATVSLTDTYTQTQANGKFINNTLTTTTGDIIYASAANTPARLGIGSTDQVLKVSGGIPAWGAAPAASFVGWSIRRDTNVNINNDTLTQVTFNDETLDSSSFHSTTVNASRVTIPSGKAGKYLVFFSAGWAANATGYRQSLLYKNGSGWGNLQTGPANATVSNYILGEMIVDLAEGDYLEVYVRQTSGGTLALNDNSYFNGIWLGA
jgi:hypothetical protein